MWCGSGLSFYAEVGAQHKGCVKFDGVLPNGRVRIGRSAVSDAAQWKLGKSAEALRTMRDGMTATLSRWVFGAKDMDGLAEATTPFDQECVITDISCPFLIVAGELDSFGTPNAQSVYDEARSAGPDVTIRWYSAEDTGPRTARSTIPSRRWN